jgi:xylose dehydrogenase (NAD/NADP)
MTTTAVTTDTVSAAARTTVRWGVLGSAWINESAVPGILAAPNAELGAMASRRPAQAAADADRWGAGASYGSYDELLADASIDAVYVPLPNMVHVDWTIRALQAGKHVLCEKPLALGARDVERIAEAAEAADRHVLEAFMYRFAPRWQRTLGLLADGTIGDPRTARLSMGFKQHYDGYNIRFDPDAGGGALWDVGCYVVNKARGLFGAEPVSIFASSWTRPGERVDTSTDLLLDFGDGKRAACDVSFDYVNSFTQDEIVGTDGWINLPGTGMRNEPFSLLQWYRWQDEIFIDGAEPTVETFPYTDNFRLEVEHLSAAILAGTEPHYGVADALANARALDAAFQSVREGRPIRL